MTNLIRWEPFGELVSMRKEFDRLFDDFLSRPSMSDRVVPLIDLYQTDDNVVARIGLPGIKPEDVDIQVTGSVLTVRGESRMEKEVEEATYHLREQRQGSFSRSVNLPTLVVADEANAEFEDGVLTITLPKAEEVKPKAIKVKAK